MHLKNLIIYHIFIDRFAGFDEVKDDSKPERIGGNLKAIIKKLPYLKKLGINCIWLSPFYKSTSYHGYDIEDFYKVDENVGCEDDLKELIVKAHKEGIRVIADFVPNHCSENHPFFVDAKTNNKSKYRNWFYFKNWPDDYLSFLHFKNLPKFNLENKEARKYVLDAALHWLKIGIDGFRLDHAIGPNKDFLKELERLARERNAFLIGEVWFFGINHKHAETIKAIDLNEIMELSKKNNSSMEDEAIIKLDILDGYLDFTFNTLVKEYLKGGMKSQEFFSKLENHYHNKDMLLPSFLDNHDMNRLIYELGNNKKLLKLASVIQFSMSQPPIIYYGDEIGLSQAMRIEELPSHGDVQARRRMEWEEQDDELIKHYQRLCILRKKIKSLREGSMKLLYADNTSRLLAFIKESDDRVLVILNPDNVNITFNLNLDQLQAKYIVDLFDDVKIENKEIRMNLQPEEFKMFLLR